MPKSTTKSASIKETKKKRSPKQVSRLAKAKGHKFVKKVIEKLRENTDLTVNDIFKPTGSAPGADIWFSQRALETYPFSIECKCVEQLGIFSAITQAEKNTDLDKEMLIVFRKNHTPTYAAVTFEYFLKLHHKARAYDSRMETGNEDHSIDLESIPGKLQA